MTDHLRADHLAPFKDYFASEHDPDARGGKMWTTFRKRLDRSTSSAVGPAASETKFSRGEVLNFAADDSAPLLDVIGAVLCWGGVDYRNVERLRPRLDNVLHLCTGLRAGTSSPRQAFSELRALRMSGKLPGLGPAYYTKLIYFLSHRHRSKCQTAYIMDQWASCSINVLTGRDVVLMNFNIPYGGRATTFSVSDLNRAENYDRFCRHMNELIEELKPLSPGGDVSPEQLDAAMMDVSRAGWRQYLIGQRRQ